MITKGFLLGMHQITDFCWFVFWGFFYIRIYLVDYSAFLASELPSAPNGPLFWLTAPSQLGLQALEHFRTQPMTISLYMP